MSFDRKKKYEEKKRSLTTSFFSGAAAGLTVDVGLFPLDTLKTRLQSQFGFWKSGGFRGIYKGVGPTAIGSAPCASIFFVTYNGFKNTCQPHVHQGQEPIVHMVGAALGEWAACIVRVPTEIIKQRRQACMNEGSAYRIVVNTFQREGIRGFFNGFWTTVLRDVPYAVIQFPLWEYFKYRLAMYQGKPVSPLEGAFCGSVAGAIAGAATTPLDVIKTQIMLSVGTRKTTLFRTTSTIYREKGLMGFFAGFIPRVMWIFLGGFIFFGVYEETCSLIDGDRKKKRKIFWEK